MTGSFTIQDRFDVTVLSPRSPGGRARLRRSGLPAPLHLGASLARLEASIAIARLTARFPGLALDGPVTWNGRINLRGPARLPVSVN